MSTREAESSTRASMMDADWNARPARARALLAGDARKSTSRPGVVGWLPYAAWPIFAAIYATLSLTRFARLSTPSWDNAIFEQAIKAYAHLQAPIVGIKAPGFNILGDHFSPIIALIAPIYRLFPHAQTLLVAQAVLVAASVIPIMRIAMRHLGAAAGIAVGVAYGLSFGIQSAIYTDFHEMAFAAPLIAFAGEAYLQRRWRAVAAWSMPLLLVKEDLGITVAVIGAVLVFCGARRIGWMLTAAGIAGFAVTVFVVIPAFNPVAHFDYWGAVGFGGNGPGVFRNLFTGWGLKAGTLLATFGITGFLALRSPWVLLALPTLGWRFIGSKTDYWGTGWHYSLILMPIVFIALIQAITILRDHRWRWLKAHTAHTPTLAVGVAVALCLSFPLHTLFDQQTYRPSPRAAAADAAIALMPHGSTVETDRGLITHLASNFHVYWFDTTGDVTPDYVLIDTGVSPNIDNAADYADKQHPRTTYRQVFDRDGYLLAHEVDPNVAAGPAQ